MDRDFAYSFKNYQKTGNAWQDLNPLTKLTVCMCVGLSTIAAMDWRYGIPLCLLREGAKY